MPYHKHRTYVPKNPLELPLILPRRIGDPLPHLPFGWNESWLPIPESEEQRQEIQDLTKQIRRKFQLEPPDNIPDPPTDPCDPNDPTQPVGIQDPNKKTGPAGYGAPGYIAAGSLMPYMIEFENDPNATAPVQIVEIADELDEDLEWTTFMLTEIAFGDDLVEVPEDTQHFETTVPMTYGDVDFEVHIDAGIHLATGEVYAKFYSVDPVTGLPPAVSVGFLPPEDGTGRGQGHISYIVRSKEGLEPGTEIRNIAEITFDFSETIATNQVDPHDPSKGTDPNMECLNTIAALVGIRCETSVPLSCHSIHKRQQVDGW